MRRNTYRNVLENRTSCCDVDIITSNQPAPDEERRVAKCSGATAKQVKGAF